MMCPISSVKSYDEPWAKYCGFRELLGLTEDDPDLSAAKQALLDHPLVQRMVEGLKDWPGEVLASHKSAGQPFHRLAFLAEIGVTAVDPGMGSIITKILDSPTEDGPFGLPMRVGSRTAGSSAAVHAWAACDAPVILYSLAKMGLRQNPKVIKGVSFLAGLVRENGWGCAVSKELGSFKGPGRKADPCPYVNVLMLRLLSLYPDYAFSRAAENLDSRINVTRVAQLP